jgi:lysozyme
MMKLRQTIKEEEGLRLFTYLCPAGKKTIGYGHNLQASPLLPYIAEFHAKHKVITPCMAECQLDHDITMAEASARRAFSNFDWLPNNKQRVLIEMAYNMGERSLNSFLKLRGCVLRKEYKQAAEEMLNSLWAKQVPDRANRLVKQWLEERKAQ